MTTSRPAALLVALAALLGSFLLAAPAHAAEQIVTITAEGVTPKVLQVAKGDTVTFVNEDSAFGYRAVATSDNWNLDSGPIGLLPGRSYTHPEPISAPGTYTYTVAEGEAFEGSVVLPSPAAAPSPTRSAAGTPSPQSGSSPSAAPAPGGGTGTAAPPVTGGFGPLDTLPTPAPGGVAPPPAIALPELLPGETLGPEPETAPLPEPESAAGPLAVPGRLGAPAGYRGYGLPAALAAVLAAGVVSLLVRLLLAEPVARRRARGAMSGPSPVATVD